MKNFLVLFFLSVVTFGCATGRRVIEREDIPGEWKEIQRRNTTKSPIMDITNCNDDSPKGLIYKFNIDGTFSQKGICPNGEPERKGTWLYSDNILAMKTIVSDDEIECKYSVTDQGNNQIKLSLVVFRREADVIDYINGYYVILEKQ